jgi:predicted ATP-grasp superfamily ATP-dependent carboligase
MISPLKILLSEGSSLSARQAITALGVAGYRVDVCDPSAVCLGRFSRFVNRFYRCPAIGRDPWKYLHFICRLLASKKYDVLFPTHEQAFLFSRMRDQIPPGVGLAVADFASFLAVQGKVALTRTLGKLAIPQPESRIVRSEAELSQERRFPFFLKLDYATASTGTWRIDNAPSLAGMVTELRARGLFNGEREWVVQRPAVGPVERVQAIFNRGRLVMIHGYRQILESVGAGDIVKRSVDCSHVRPYIVRLGEHLQWYGALSFDYILEDDTPQFIDANPRLVEPVNALLSGVNLADALVRISCGEAVEDLANSQPGVRTHMLLMGLLTAALKRNSRIDVLRELARAIGGSEPYKHSREELLPLRLDPTAVLPFAYVLMRLLSRPLFAETLSAGTVAAYSLGPESARQVASEMQ